MEHALAQAPDGAYIGGATGTVSGDTATIEMPAYTGDGPDPQYQFVLTPQEVPFIPTHVRIEIDVDSGTAVFRPELYFQFLEPMPGVASFADFYGWDGDAVETVVSPGTWSWAWPPTSGVDRHLYRVSGDPGVDLMPLFLESLAAGVDGPGGARMLYPGPGPLSISRFQIIVYADDPVPPVEEILFQPWRRQLGRNALSQFHNRTHQQGLRQFGIL